MTNHGDPPEVLEELDDENPLLAMLRKRLSRIDEILEEGKKPQEYSDPIRPQFFFRLGDVRVRVDDVGELAICVFESLDLLLDALEEIHAGTFRRTP